MLLPQRATRRSAPLRGHHAPIFQIGTLMQQHRRAHPCRIESGEGARRAARAKTLAHRRASEARAAADRRRRRFPQRGAHVRRRPLDALPAPGAAHGLTEQISQFSQNDAYAALVGLCLIALVAGKLDLNSRGGARATRSSQPKVLALLMAMARSRLYPLRWHRCRLLQ
jgi:hypothetical protein